MDVRIDRQGTVAKDAWSLKGVLQQSFLVRKKSRDEKECRIERKEF